MKSLDEGLQLKGWKAANKYVLPKKHFSTAFIQVQ